LYYTELTLLCFSTTGPMAVAIAPRVAKVIVTRFLFESLSLAFKLIKSSPEIDRYGIQHVDQLRLIFMRELVFRTLI
jgi:hypothetical protein